MGSRTLRLRVAGLLAASVVAVACSPGAGSAPPAASEPAATAAGSAPASASAAAETCTETVDLNIGYHSISQSVWPIWIAKERGFLDKYGINGTLVFAEGARVLSGVISKATPISFVSGADILDPVSQGADIVAIMASGSTPTDMIVGGKGITKPEDLKGKIAGANELGGESDSLIRLGLESMGLVPDVDTRVVSVGGESTRIAALQAGQVQATLVDVGLRKEMADAGFTTLYDFTTGDYKLLKGTLITTKSYAAENPEVVQCVVNALVDAVRYYKANKTESVDAAAVYSGDMNRTSLETLWDIYAPNIPDSPTVDTEALTNLQDLSDEPKIKEVDVTTVIDNSFVENVSLKD